MQKPADPIDAVHRVIKESMSLGESVASQVRPFLGLQSKGDKSKKQPRTAGTVGAEVVSFGEINVDKSTEQILMAQDHRPLHIPETLPKLIAGANGTFLDYSGLLIPVTEEQAHSHQVCLQQHLQEVAYVS